MIYINNDGCIWQTLVEMVLERMDGTMIFVQKQLSV